MTTEDLEFQRMETAFGVLQLKGQGVEGETQACASFRREEALQFRFMVFYQRLVAFLAVVVLILTVAFLWEILKKDDLKVVVAALEAAGAVASGGLVAFLLNQRKDARRVYKAAQRGVTKHCN